MTSQKYLVQTSIVVAAVDDDIGANRLQVSQRKGKKIKVLDSDSRTALQTLRKTMDHLARSPSRSAVGKRAERFASAL